MPKRTEKLGQSIFFANGKFDALANFKRGNETGDNDMATATLAINPGWQPMAFKEWQLVCDALAAGEQSLLLRKGGISEGKTGFQWAWDEFFLFPGRYHEQADHLQPAANGKMRVLAAESAKDEISISLFARILSKGKLSQWEDVKGLNDFHIWNEDTVRSRFEWGDQPGISWAEVEIWKLPQPWILLNREEFGGCRSWVELPAEEADHVADKLRQAEKVKGTPGIPAWLKQSALV